MTGEELLAALKKLSAEELKLPVYHTHSQNDGQPYAIDYEVDLNVDYLMVMERGSRFRPPE